VTETQTEPTFAQLVRLHETTCLAVDHSGPETYYDCLAAFVDSERGLFAAHDAQIGSVEKLEAEIAEHEEQLRSAMLGIDTNDDPPCGRCLTLQAEVVRQGAVIVELEHIAELAMEWAANYPYGDGTDKHAAREIYGVCEQADIGQLKE